MRRNLWVLGAAALLAVSSDTAAQRGGRGGYGREPMSRPTYGGERQTSTTAHGPYGGTAGGESREGAAGGEYGRAEGQSRSGYAMGPGGGSAAGESRGGSATGQYGATASGESRGGVYRGPGGTTVAGGEKSGTVTGPGGTTASGTKSGAVVMGPNGNVHATGSTSGEVTGAGGTTVAGTSQKTAVVGPDGAAYGTSRAGAATTPYGTVAGGSRTAAATTPYGTAYGTSHAAAATGPYGAAAATSQTTAVSAGTRYASPSTVQAQGTAVRGSYPQTGAFTPNWNAAHPAAWTAGRYTTGTVYAPGNWGGTAAYIGVAPGQAAYQYNYGTNVTCQGGNVYYGSQVTATEPQYAQQAAAIAQTGQAANPPAGDAWQPLGVFALTKGDETQSHDTLQLAVNREGVVRGNYYNAVADTTQPVAGSVDPKSQRVAWTVGGKKDVVYETGLYNLSLDDTSVLAHLGPNRTEQYGLFRLPPPDGRGPGQ
jgi:hypothetical protein